MIQRSEAFKNEGAFWGHLRTAITEGVRDLDSGYDRVAFDWLDPRVNGGGTLDFVLLRALADAWRTPVGREPMDVLVMAGAIRGGNLQVQSVPLDFWPRFTGIHFAADGPVSVTSGNSMARRIRVDQGAEALGELFGEAASLGDLTITVGLLGAGKEPVLEHAARLVGEECPHGVGILMLYEPNPGPVDIGTMGGPMRNCWHIGLHATNHMSHSHLSGAYLNLLGSDDAENWYDDDFRKRVYDNLKVVAAERQVVLTKRGFLDALAEGSSLRKFLPQHLTRFFPDGERLFWCLPEGVYPEIDPLIWDDSSPAERLALLSAVRLGTSPGFWDE